MFEMKPEYYIGIDMIDQEHKQLFDYASEAYELLQEEFTPDKYDRIDAILEKLRDYTVKHFTDEGNQDEQIMDILNYLTDWLINHILHVDGQIPKEA
mgnify:CR=1 FL=1